MLSWTLVVCLAVAASAESTESDGLACNETIVQQLNEIGQRIGSFLPDPWLLSSQSSGSRKGKGSLLGWGLVSGLSWSKAEPPLDNCGSQLVIKVPLQGLARLALPFASTPLYFQGAAAVTANLTFPGPRVTGLSVEEVKLTDLALKKGVKEGDRVGDFLLQVTSRVVDRSIREQLPRLLLVALAPQSPLVLERRLLVY
uniref:Putative conserved secreted protein n=1 Tax=Rhipicephalus microplus TaxID=6941 RepID=A0A6M2D5B7_RHIMP